MIANSPDESSAHPAPAVARVRRTGALSAAPPAPSAPSPAEPDVSGPKTSDLGAFSTDAMRPPATASGRPISARVGSDSPPTMATTATKPPASEASGVTIERLPVTRPRSRQASPAASHRPLTTAKPTARHSAEPLGGPSEHQRERQEDREPHAHRPGERGPDGRRAHDLDHEEVMQGVTERRAQAEDDGEHARTLLDPQREGIACVPVRGDPGMRAARPDRDRRPHTLGRAWPGPGAPSVRQRSVAQTVKSAKLRGARPWCLSAMASASASRAA